MRTPQIPAMPGMSPLGLTNARNVDEKTVAQRKWQAPKLAPKPQQPCDVGLFSDDSKQQNLF
jgi:hypothetical protein